MSSENLLPAKKYDSLLDMFADLPERSGWEIKLEQVAIDLCALMDQAGKTRAEMAEELGVNKSVITKMLAGDNNTTIKKIWQFSEKLGFDFDVIFHGAHDERPLQPWERTHWAAQSPNMIQVEFPDNGGTVKLQSADEVVNDFYFGKANSCYLSVTPPEHGVFVSGQFPQVPFNTSNRIGEMVIPNQNAIYSVQEER